MWVKTSAQALGYFQESVCARIGKQPDKQASGPPSRQLSRTTRTAAGESRPAFPKSQAAVAEGGLAFSKG
jgi:hypothetical protein